VLLLTGSETAFFNVAFVGAALTAFGCLAISRQGKLAQTVPD